MSTKLLEGERALITGCAGGIGRGIAKALKDEGATVLGSDIAAPPAGDGIDFLAADLSKRDGWKSLLDGALKKLGSISLFVHAASPRRLEVDTPLSVVGGDVGRHDRHQPALGFLPGPRGRTSHARQRDQGPHPADHLAAPRNAPQPAALQRLEGRHDHGDEGARPRAGADGIRVNAIAPGAIPGGGFVADNLGELVAQIPLGRAGTPDDIAQVAVAVLSERFGRYVVGTTVEVDGGIGLISWIPAKA